MVIVLLTVQDKEIILQARPQLRNWRCPSVLLLGLDPFPSSTLSPVEACFAEQCLWCWCAPMMNIFLFCISSTNFRNEPKKLQNKSSESQFCQCGVSTRSVAKALSEQWCMCMCKEDHLGKTSIMHDVHVCFQRDATLWTFHTFFQDSLLQSSVSVSLHPSLCKKKTQASQPKIGMLDKPRMQKYTDWQSHNQFQALCEQEKNLWCFGLSPFKEFWMSAHVVNTGTQTITKQMNPWVVHSTYLKMDIERK